MVGNAGHLTPHKAPKVVLLNTLSNNKLDFCQVAKIYRLKYIK